MRTRLIYAILASGALAACAPATMRPGVVYDQAKDAVGQAAAAPTGETAEKALLPPLAVEMPKNVQTEPRFDLSVVNAPASQVFMALVNGTPYNMLVTPEVSGQITIRLKDVTVREALDAIRDLYGYEYNIKGNRISILPNTIQTKVFRMNYLASKRVGSSEVRVISGSSQTGPTGGAPGVPGAAVPGATPTATPTTPTGTIGAVPNNPTSRVSTTTSSDFWTGVTDALKTIIGSGEDRSVVVSPDSGVIVIRGLPRELRDAENYLKATQLIVERQVILEAKIIDVTLSQDYQTGVNWGAFKTGPNSFSGAGVAGPTTTIGTSSATGAARSMFANNAATTVTGSSVGSASVSPGAAGTATVTPGRFGSFVASALGKGFFGLAFQTSNFAALLNFLETQGSVSVLSSPRIATLNNQKAVLKVGTDDLFVTNVTTTTTTSTTGNIVTPTVTLQSYFSGIALDVTPQIDEDNNIILHIHPAVSVVTEKQKTIDLGAALGGSFTLPLASSSVNETDSIVRAKDGNIIAIGGLMRQEQDVTSTGLPGTGRSAAGVLFGQRGNTLNKRELVILLRPTVVTDDGVWSQESQRTSSRLRELDPAAQFSLEDK
ncbi:MAG TPA: secretin N-terminal domain-containing protein [Rhodocyclaceae bacterium]